jgi:hypothetical protein
VQTTTPVPEGAWRVADSKGAPAARSMAAGSRTDRRATAAPGVQDEAKHAMSAPSRLKSCEVEKPQPQRQMPNMALLLVAAAVLHARDQPSTYSSRRPGRYVPTMVDQVVSFTIATDDVIETVPPPLAW